MPFQSEKQRRYLWANEPRIARDWSKKYGSRVRKDNGGIMDKIMPYVYPEAHGEKYSTRGQWAKNTPQYHRDITENYFDELSQNWSQLPYVGKPAAAAIELFAPAATGVMSLPYDTYSAFKKFYDNPQKYEDAGKWGKVNDLFPGLADTNVAGILSALDREDMFSAAGNRFVGAARPLAQRMQKGWDAIKNEFSGSAQAGEPDKNNYSQEFADLYKQGKYDNLSLAMQDADRYNRGETTNYEKIIGKNPITDIYDRDYTAGEHYNMTPDARTRAMQTRGPFSNTQEEMMRNDINLNKRGVTPIAQKLANLDKFVGPRPQTGFEEHDKWGNRRMAQEKMDPARPQRKGLGSGITSAWGALTGSPLFSAAAQAFRGPQLTQQQKQMNTNFMTNYGVTRAPPTMGGRMVGGPFAGMNAPGTSAFGSKTSQEMAQKWALKNQHRQYTTPKMQQKQQNIINIATGGRDPGTGTTVTGHGKSGMGRDPSDRMARGGIASLWPR